MQDANNANVTTVQVALPANLLSMVDKLIIEQFVDREEFIREAVRRYVEHLRATTPEA